MPIDHGDKSLVRIDLPTAGEWVEVKRKLGRDDERRSMQIMFTGQKKKINDGAPSFDELDIGPFLGVAAFAVMAVAIQRWSFDEPVTLANCQALDDESVEAIKVRLEELYPVTLPDAEKKGLSLPSPTPIPTEDPILPNSAGGPSVSSSAGTNPISRSARTPARTTRS